MSELVHIDVTGDRRVGLRFEQFPDALTEDLRATISALTEQLFALVEAATPSRTGRLHSQERQAVFIDNGKITGKVGIAGEGSGKLSDFAKAGALEYGSTGRLFKVAAHAMRLDHFMQSKFDAPMMVIVKAHERRGTIAEHAFMRGPLGAMEGEILTGLNAAVGKAARDANG